MNYLAMGQDSCSQVRSAAQLFLAQPQLPHLASSALFSDKNLAT